MRCLFSSSDQATIRSSSVRRLRRRGNTTVLRCHLPTFVREYVAVDSWIRDDKQVLKRNDMKEILAQPEEEVTLLPYACIAFIETIQVQYCNECMYPGRDAEKRKRNGLSFGLQEID
ncbi:hypothetical protein CEXT_75761 [Caerostris extrusa]|uniref:Uncharacterized protein n=1 Tax=Caerostris extrusa TaxID=172846 RepID=A0AAV4NLX2_CAEEX|nr:hypothetical protein CEXT_75761 [Caerostris extrusa]